MRHKPDSTAANVERRADDRHLTVYRVAKVVRHDNEGLWCVRNMSNRGMLFEVDVPVSPNEELTIVLSDALRLVGRVVWSGDDRCGIVFDEPVNVGKLLRELVADHEGDGYRPLRLSLRAPARLLRDASETDVIVTSLSRQGIGFSCDRALREGERVHIALADGRWRGGIVKWF